MRVPVAWLREYCDPGTPAEEIGDALTMAGLKVERLHRVGVGDVSHFVIGRVLSAEPHPDADRLTVCSVDIGASAPSTIVCGAPNVAAGQIVAVASPGAVMPDGSTLGKAKLRGIESHGMILAEDEVGIGEDHQGIMVLDEGLVVGAPLSEHLPIIDEVLELEITPNRPDAMGVLRRGPRRARRDGRVALRGPDRPRRRAERRRQRRGPRERRDRRPRDMPALHRARVRGREDRAVAALAEAAADGRGPAADLERRRHHELRDAHDGAAAARVRPRRGARAPDRRSARRRRARR